MAISLLIGIHNVWLIMMMFLAVELVIMFGDLVLALFLCVTGFVLMKLLTVQLIFTFEGLLLDVIL